MYYSEAQARDLVVKAGHMLQEKGLVERTWGNISARISETRFVITPSGLAYETMRPSMTLRTAAGRGPISPPVKRASTPTPTGSGRRWPLSYTPTRIWPVSAA